MTEPQFAPASPERVAINESVFRDANEEIRDRADEFGLTQRVPFICECAEPSCRELVPVTLDEYRRVRQHQRWFLSAPGHHEAARGMGKVVESRDGYEIVEKVGEAGEIAERLAEEGVG